MLVFRTMRALGSGAAAGKAVEPAVRSGLAEVARKAPLAPEPFLLTGAIAQTEGRSAAAARLFHAARARDPRSGAARYFLADHYLRTGELDAGLGEVVAMSRLVPGSADALVPALASLASDPAALDPLRRFIRRAPDHGAALLGVLAADADNAATILKLAGNPPLPGGWQARLPAAMVEKGDYAGARRLWAKLARVEGADLFNPGFAPSHAPPPFNWRFAESGGLADPTGKGGLEVVYYGREDVALASQMLVLAPGRYRLAMNVSGDREARGLSWRLRCLPGSVRLDLPLRRAADGPVEGPFSIPASGCSGQMLELRGSSVGGAGDVSIGIDHLRLDKVVGA